MGSIPVRVTTTKAPQLRCFSFVVATHTRNRTHSRVQNKQKQSCDLLVLQNVLKREYGVEILPRRLLWRPLRARQIPVHLPFVFISFVKLRYIEDCTPIISFVDASQNLPYSRLLGSRLCKPCRHETVNLHTESLTANFTLAPKDTICSHNLLSFCTVSHSRIEM